MKNKLLITLNYDDGTVLKTKSISSENNVDEVTINILDIYIGTVPFTPALFFRLSFRVVAFEYEIT